MRLFVLVEGRIKALKGREGGGGEPGGGLGELAILATR